MKKLVTVVMAGLLLAAFALPAFAWEFSMTGEYDFRFRYWSRIGDKDLFGLAGIQDATGATTTPPTPGVYLNFTQNPVPYSYEPAFNVGVPNPLPAVNKNGQVFTVQGNPKIGFAGPNFYGSGQIVPANSASTRPLGVGVGTIISRGGFSETGSDGIYADQRLTLVPNIRVNPAIRVHGVYNIGGIRNRFNQTNSGMGIAPFERYGMVSTNTGSQDTWGIGSWEQVRATVRTPWGILSYGMKDFPFGLGLFTSQRTRGSAFVAVVPYGPFRFIPAFWHGNSPVNGTYSENYRPDGANKAFWFGGFLFTYEVGPLSCGGGWVGRNYAANFANALGVGSTGLGAEQILNVWAWYYKFNNGRFFSNAEYDWGNIDTPSLKAQNSHVEQYHAFAEIGAYAGPAKLGFMWAQGSGPVRNNWSADDVNHAGYTAATNGSNPKRYGTWGIDWQVLDPYQYLMFGTYAGGNQTFNGLFLGDDGKGMMSDAMALAARLDYAVAANLNVYGTFMYAKRLEKYGTYMGQYYSDGRDTMASTFQKSTSDNGDDNLYGLNGTSALTTTVAGQTLREFFRNNAGVATNPNTYKAGYSQDAFVPDDLLGWELNVGCDWKLLEHMTARMRYAYWQPGEWFDFAYQGIGVRPGGSYSASAYIGSRDPIQAFEGSFVIDF